jgi:hypothetical protein
MNNLPILTVLFGSLGCIVFLAVWGMAVYRWHLKYLALDMVAISDTLRQTYTQFKVAQFILMLGPLFFLMYPRPFTALFVFIALAALFYLKRSYEPALSLKLAPYMKPQGDNFK